MQRDKEKEHGWEIVKDRCTHRQRVRERGGGGGESKREKERCWRDKKKENE